MARHIGGGEHAPANVKFNCPESGDWITDGNEPIVEFEESAGMGHQTNTTHGMKCPGCDGYVKFETGHTKPIGIHKYAG
jgi:hypothetical protein